MKTFKDWIKDWDLEQIVDHCFTTGMKYMATDILKDWEKDKIIIINELNRRNNMKNWTKKFDKEYASFFQEVEAYGVKSDIVSFINTLLEKQRKDIVKKIEEYRRTRLNKEVLEAIDDIINIIK